MQHETGLDDAGAAMLCSIEYSPEDIANGARNMDVFGVIPDWQRIVGTVDLTVLTKQYPNDTYTEDGPYSLTADDTTPRVDLRSDGQMLGFRLASQGIGYDFRLGVIRIDVQPAGARQ